MRKIFFILSILAAYPAICQKANETVAINFAEGVFTPGNHKFEILEKNVPADLKEIITKYRNAVADSMAWYNTYSQKYKNQNPLPYHSNFGISEADYDRMNKEFPLLKMKIKTTKELTINKSEGQIGFKGNDGFTIFDGVAFDLTNKTLVIGGKEIPYIGEISEGETSGVGAWKGYYWKLEVGNMADVKAFKPVDYTMIDLSIGKTQGDNKIVVQYKTIYVDAGDPKINGSLTGYLK